MTFTAAKLKGMQTIPQSHIGSFRQRAAAAALDGLVSWADLSFDARSGDHAFFGDDSSIRLSAALLGIRDRSARGFWPDAGKEVSSDPRGEADRSPIGWRGSLLRFAPHLALGVAGLAATELRLVTVPDELFSYLGVHVSALAAA